MEGTYTAHRHICSCLDRCADSSPFTLFILPTVLHKNVFPGFAQLDIQRRLFLFSPFVTNPAASHSRTWCTLTKRLLAINMKWRVFIYILYYYSVCSCSHCIFNQHSQSHLHLLPCSSWQRRLNGQKSSSVNVQTTFTSWHHLCLRRRLTQIKY